MFFAIITAYCLCKLSKKAECQDILNEYKTLKAEDSVTAKY